MKNPKPTPAEYLLTVGLVAVAIIGVILTVGQYQGRW